MNEVPLPRRKPMPARRGKSLFLAYALWGLGGFTALCGLHRLYLGKWKSGLGMLLLCPGGVLVAAAVFITNVSSSFTADTDLLGVVSDALQHASVRLYILVGLLATLAGIIWFLLDVALIKGMYASAGQD